MIKMKDIVMIHDLKRQGFSIAAIARETGVEPGRPPREDDVDDRRHVAVVVCRRHPKALNPLAAKRDNLDGSFDVVAVGQVGPQRHRIARRPPECSSWAALVAVPTWRRTRCRTLMRLPGNFFLRTKMGGSWHWRGACHQCTFEGTTSRHSRAGAKRINYGWLCEVESG